MSIKTTKSSSSNGSSSSNLIKRFSGISLGKNSVEIVDETEEKNGTALTKLEIKKLIEQVKSKIAEIKINAVAQIRKILSDQKNPPIDIVIESGVVPLLTECLKTSDSKLQYETAWVLTNIASGTFEQTKAIIDAGAVPILLQLLHSSDHNVANQSAWALGNIIADKTQFYNYCIESGFVEEILKLDFEKLRIKNLRTLTWIMANLCRNKELCPTKNIGLQFLPILEPLIYNKDDEILIQTLLAITFLTDPNDEQRIHLEDTVLKRLAELFSHRDLQIQSSALTILTYITFNNNIQTKLLIDYGILTQIDQFLTHPKARINKQACLFLSSIMNDKGHWIQEIIDANLVESMIKLLSVKDFRKLKEALLVTFKIIHHGDEKQIQYLIKMDVIFPLCFLITETSNIEILEISLFCIKNVLDKAETYLSIVIQQLLENAMKEKIENLADHKNSEISNIVKEIKGGYLSF